MGLNNVKEKCNMENKNQIVSGAEEKLFLSILNLVVLPCSLKF